MKRRTRESVLFPAGCVLSLFVLSLVSAGDPAPYIQFIAPTEGQAGNAFTLLGRNFDPTPAGNTIQFEIPTGVLTAQVTSASEIVLTGIVPNGVERGTSLLRRVYRVTVTTDQGTSNGVGFTPERQDAPLVLRPYQSHLLLAPGSGTTTLIIGGGRPPYTMLPLDASVESIATVEFVDTAIHVTGIAPGEVKIKVQDSSNPPQQLPWGLPSIVVVQNPRFQPRSEIAFHTLLAGSAPPFVITTRVLGVEMQIEQIEIRLENAEIDLSSLIPGKVFGLVELRELSYGWAQHETWHFEISAVNETQAEFDLISFEDDGADIMASGRITRDPPALIMQMPGLRAGWVFMEGNRQELTFFDQWVRLAQTAGETFSVTATFTSVSVAEDDYLPMQHAVTRSFTTTGPMAPGPRIERLLPICGEAGRYVRIRGPGFDPNQGGYQVTFAGVEETRVPANIHRVQEGQIIVPVPINAVTGPMRVEVNGQASNDYLFEVGFRPQAGIFFTELKADTPTGPLIIIEQPTTFEQRSWMNEFGDEVRVATASFTLDAGSLNLNGLSYGQIVGHCRIDDVDWRRSSEHPIEYLGQESEEPMRHMFDIRMEPGTIYVSPGRGGMGARFDLTANGLSRLGRTVRIQFEHPIYRPPATRGVDVNTRTEVVSEPWKGRFSEMQVIKRGIVRVQ